MRTLVWVEFPVTFQETSVGKCERTAGNKTKIVIQNRERRSGQRRSIRNCHAQAHGAVAVQQCVVQQPQIRIAFARAGAPGVVNGGVEIGIHAQWIAFLVMDFNPTRCCSTMEMPPVGLLNSIINRSSSSMRWSSSR